MHFIVVGANGSIGQKRTLILEEMGHKVKKIDSANNTFFYPEMAEDSDAVIICAPPVSCVDVGLQCVEAKVPFFIEKPGAINHRQFLTLVNKCEKQSLITMVSCNLRFTSEYRAIQDALPNLGTPVFAQAEFGYFLPFWREGQYRTYYSCYRMAGGGILLDSIHEMDYMFSLFGFPNNPKALIGTHNNTKELTDLDAEDNANLFVVYQSGLSMVIHLDYLQRAYKRTFSAVGTKGRIDQTFNVQGSSTMYKREMQHFIECVKKGVESVKPVDQHLKLLELVDKIKNTSDEHPN